MAKHIFKVTLEGEIVLELDDAVIDAIDAEWRSMFYKLYTPEDIAEHIAYNLVINRARLSFLDGWADQPDENARILELPGYWEVTAE